METNAKVINIPSPIVTLSFYYCLRVFQFEQMLPCRRLGGFSTFDWETPRQIIIITTPVYAYYSASRVSWFEKYRGKFKNCITCTNDVRQYRSFVTQTQ